MELNKLSQEIHANAVSKGFWDEKFSDDHCLMLVICELAEAVEADMIGRRFDKCSFENKRDNSLLEESSRFKFAFEVSIEGTVEEKLCDAVIRLLDLAGARGVDLTSSENMIKYYGYAVRENFTESLFGIIKHLDKDIEMSIARIFKLAQHMRIDLEWHIEQKMRYNQSREKMHGKKY